MERVTFHPMFLVYFSKNPQMPIEKGVSKKVIIFYL
jgi:hypothetical protein